MAYLPSDVLKKLREAAANGSKSAQNALKASGNVNNKPVTPAQTAPNSQPTSALQQMLAQTNPSEQSTVPAWVKALEDKPHNEDKEKQKYDFMRITEQAQKDAEERRKQAKEDADKRNSGSYLDASNSSTYNGEEVLDHIEKDTAKFATNAKYKVNVVDSSNSKYAMDKDVELWYISDSNGVHESKANSAITSIGKNNLEGAQEGQDYVLYNKRTNELYQYSGDTEATDNVKKYQEAEDKYNKMYYSGQQSIAELEKKLEGIDKTLQFKCEQYHIDITKPLSTSQLAMIQDYIDEYDAVEEQLRSQQYSINRSLNTQADYIANLKGKQDITKAIDLNEYLTAQDTVQKYADIQAVLSGQMSRNNYLAQYKTSPTVQEMNKLAQEAVDAQYILDNAGTVVDTYGMVTPELNEMANQYADLDERYANIIIDTAKVYNKEMTEEEFKERYGTDANTDLNMMDDKQLNSMIDVVRRFYVTERWDAENWKDRVIAVGAALDDCKTVRNTNIDAIKNGHLVTPVLNIMRDAGNVLTGYATAAFNARGFSGKQNVSLAGQTVSPAMRDQLGDELDQSFAFKDGALQNAEYYYGKADDRDYLTGLDRLKQNLHNWDVAMEAQMRGDLSGDLTINNVAITNNGVENTYLDQHPLVLGALDLATNIIFDPSTYVTAIANSTGKISETAAGKELTSKYSSIIRQSLLDAGIADDMIDAEKIANILDSTLDAQMLKRGAKQLDESGIIRAVNSVADNTDFIVKYSDEATKLSTLKIASEEAIRVINDVTTDSTTVKLWKDCFSSARTAANWRKLDQTINDFQMGFIPAAVRECVKPAIKDFKLILNGGLKTMGFSNKVTATTANWFNGFLERVTKLTHGGKTLDELRTFSKLEKGMGAAAVSDIIKSADNLDDAVRGVSELSKLSDTTRVEVIRNLVDSDMQIQLKQYKD